MTTFNNIAIIEDDAISQFIAKKTVKSANLTESINVFSNGLEAINYFKENISNPDKLPDLILLDLNMPVLNGWGFLEEYVKLKPMIAKTISICILSSSMNPADFIKAKEITPIDDIISKPINAEKLTNMVNAISLSET
jgi:CheY-like chemotaxis protein